MTYKLSLVTYTDLSNIAIMAQIDSVEITTNKSPVNFKFNNSAEQATSPALSRHRTQNSSNLCDPSFLFIAVLSESAEYVSLFSSPEALSLSSPISL